MTWCTPPVAALTLALWVAGCMRLDPPPKFAWPEVETSTDTPQADLDAACVADYQPGVDYFPDKTAFTYSTQLRVEYGPHYKRITFTPSMATGKVFEYLFVQCGPHISVVQVPIQRLVTGNSAMLGALEGRPCLARHRAGHRPWGTPGQRGACHVRRCSRKCLSAAPRPD